MSMAANYGLTRVKFLKSWKGYNPGDLGGFLPIMAQRLVTSGVASFDKIEKPAVTVNKVASAPALNPTPKRKYITKKKKSKPEPKSASPILDSAVNYVQGVAAPEDKGE